MQPARPVLVDTNIIIEAVRVGVWVALTGHFHIETVKKCCEEARTGDLYRPGYVRVSDADLKTRLTDHPVSDRELAVLTLKDPESFRLDAGERHLWAYALGRNDDWQACCCDHAAVNAVVRLGWAERLVSLEDLVNAAGERRAAKMLKDQFRLRRLLAWRTEALLKRGLE